jgi:DNA-binding transcriptional MerR regulator
MSDLIPIGRFAQITRLTIKALHIYDELGLLRPAVVDADSGYRYYSITQLPLGRRIRLLRSIDMPLDAIHAALHAPTPTAMDALLRDHRRHLADRIARDQSSLRLLQQLIDHRADDMAFSVQVKDVPAQLVASIRLRASPEDESGAIPVLIDELHAATTRLGVRHHAHPPVRISHEFGEDRVDSEIAVPITAPVPDTDSITCRELDAGPVAWVMHVGPHADLWAVYWAILVWLREHEYHRHGPPREVYWTHPAEGHAASYRTEVQWPIRPGHPHPSNR